MKYEQKQKIIARIFLFFFIAGIIAWLVSSNIGFATLEGARGREVPFWLKDWTPLNRLIFLNMTFQIYYYLILAGLFIEFLNPHIEFKWNKNRALALIGGLMIVDAVFTIFWNGALKGFEGGIYDTMVYGLGFGILFLLKFDPKTIGMRIALWTRLIEMGGLAIGYFMLPGILSMWPSNAYVLDHVAHGPIFMLTNPYFWSDNLVAIPSWIGVMILLRKSGASRFWITSFAIGSIIVGFSIAKYIIGVV